MRFGSDLELQATAKGGGDKGQSAKAGQAGTMGTLLAIMKVCVCLCMCQQRLQLCFIWLEGCVCLWVGKGLALLENTFSYVPPHASPRSRTSYCRPPTHPHSRVHPPF